MDILNRTDIKSLLNGNTKDCLSIYMPATRVAGVNREDPIRLHNLLKEGEEELKKRELRLTDVKSILSQAQDLVGDTMFWKHQSNGLALFISSERTSAFRLPMVFEPQVHVMDRFYIKPLFPLFTPDGIFYILAISKRNIRFWQASRFSIEEITLSELPHSVQEALHFREKERHLQFHTRTSDKVSTDRRQAMFHGQGTGVDDEKEELIEFLLRVEKSITHKLRDERAPLILAGVEYECSMYKKTNQYPYLIEQIIYGNPKLLNNDDVHRLAWEIVGPQFDQVRQATLNKFHELRHTVRATKDIGAILAAAHLGKVDTLLVRHEGYLWGLFDEIELSVEMHSQKLTGDVDLLDLAAAYTLLGDGQVYTFDNKEMPGESFAAALFRY